MKYKVAFPQFDDDMEFEIEYGWHLVQAIPIMTMYGNGGLLLLLAEGEE